MTPTGLNIKPLARGDEARWDAYVEGAEGGSFFHLSGWRQVLGEAFGHAAYYVFAEREGRIRGVLPLIHINSRLFSTGLISGAFGVYGGTVADDAASRAALDQYADGLLQQTGADFLEYRSLTATRPDWRHKDELYVTFRRVIDPSMDVNLKAIPRKQRAVIRKAIKAEKIADVIDDDIERLFRIYAESVRNLGTPVFAKRYLALLAEVFGKSCQVLTVEGPDGEPLASVMSFFFRDQVLAYYGGGTMAARAFGANDFMYWRVMERAREAGCRLFDFGRSKRGTGSFLFKKHWGMEPEPLCYEFKMCGDLPIPDIKPLNPKYALFIAAWKRLPLPVANFIGPFLARDLG
jgi:FemAB-related protein (PEP-CTERM system-associated)